LYEDKHENIQQIEDFVPSTFDSDSWVNNDEELKEDLMTTLQCFDLKFD
jgi:hypothetical protein